MHIRSHHRSQISPRPETFGHTTRGAIVDGGDAGGDALALILTGDVQEDPANRLEAAEIVMGHFRDLTPEQRLAEVQQITNTREYLGLIATNTEAN